MSRFWSSGEIAAVRSGGRPAFGAAMLILLAIVAVATIIRVQTFRGYIGLDDGEYARLAHLFATGEFVRAEYAGPPVFPLRVGIIAPTSWLFRLVGVGEWTLVLYPLVLSVLSVVVVFCCASVLFDRRAGLLAAALLAVYPADINSSTQLLPDLPAAFFAAVAVTLICYFTSSPIRAGRIGLLGGGCLAGLSLGLAWLCKESVSFLAPFIALLAILTVSQSGSRIAWVWAGVAAGSVTVLAGEMLAYYQVSGDFLFRFHEVERNYAENQKYFFGEGSAFGWSTGTGYRRALLNRLFVDGPAMIFLNRTYLFLPLVGVAATGYAVYRRDRRLLVPALWFWTLALMFNFSSSSTEAYVPLALFNRYLYPIFFPAVVLAAGFFTTVLAERRHTLASATLRWAAAAGALLIASYGAIDLYRAVRYPSRWLADVRSINPLVAPDRPVYADTLTLRALEFLAAYPRDTRWVDFSALSSVDGIAAHALVVVNRPAIEWLDQHGGIWGSARSGYRQHDFYSRPPEFWAPLRHSEEFSVYRVSGVEPADWDERP